MRIAPTYSQPTVYVLDASRVTAVVSDLLDPARRATLDQENRSNQERLRDLHAERDRKPLLPYPRALENRHRVRVRRPARAGVPRHARRRARAGDAARLRRLAVLLPRLGPEGQVPRDPRAARGAGALRRRAGAARPDRPRRPAHRARRARLLAGVVRRRGHRGRGRACGSRMLRQQSDYGDSRPNRSLADYVAPAGDHLGAFAVGHLRRGRARGALRGRARRLPRDPDQGARRPAGGGVRGVPARGEPPRLVRAGRAARERRADRRALPRDPARLRVPGLSRPLREGEALRAARRRGARARAHRDVRGHAGRRRQRHLPRTTRRRATSPSAGSAATRSSPTPRARASRSPRSSAGCARTSPTSPTSGRWNRCSRPKPRLS